YCDVSSAKQIFTLTEKEEVTVGGFCADLASLPGDQGVLDLASCNDALTQKWNYTGAFDNIAPSPMRECMDVFYGIPKAGVAINTYRCNDQQNQTWHVLLHWP